MSTIGFRPATEADFEWVLDLSIRVMRPHLERLGRFDPARRRIRMRAQFDAGGMHVIERAGTPIGCLALRPRGPAMELQSFFLDTAEQGRGLGAAIFAQLRARHPGRGWWIEVLKESPARRFWERQGFVQTGEEPFDWVMERSATAQ